MSERAQAHVQTSPTLNNRYLKLSLVGGGRVRVAYTVMFGEAPATAARRQADLDGSGTIDEREATRFAERLAKDVAAGLKVDVDGARVAPAWEPPLPGFSDFTVGPIPFSVDVIGQIPAPGPGPHELRLDDETPLADLGETEIRIEEGPGTRVLAAWRARDDGTRTMKFLWNGPKYSAMEDRSVGFRFVDEKARRAIPGGLRALFYLAGAAVLAAAAALFVRARRR